MKRTMEIKKKEEYTLLNTCRKQKLHSPPLAVAASPANITIEDDDDDEGTPPPPPPPKPPPPPPSPPKKEDTSPPRTYNIIVQTLLMRMSPRDWYEFVITHSKHAQTLLPDL